jgi:hypothetical protein
VALLCGCGGEEGGAVARALRSRPLQWLGRRSYSWYLWHWPLLVLAQVAFPQGGAPLRLLCVALSLGLAAATLRLVENPIRHSRSLAPRPVLTLAAAAALTLVAAGVAVGGRQLAVRLQERPSQALYTRASMDKPQLPAECHLPYFTVEAGECVFGDPAGRVTVALFGDSHAVSWFPAMERLARENGWKLVSLTKAGCGAAAVRPPGQLGAVDRTCMEWREATLARLSALRPHAVVMTSSTNFIDAAGGGAARTRRAAEWEAGTRRTLAAFRAARVPVVLLRDTPWPDEHVPHCLGRSAWTAWWRGPRPCTFERTNEVSELAERLERRAAAAVPGVRYVEMTDQICRASPCHPQREGTVLYYDSHHLTATFSASLAPALEREIRPLLPPGAARVPPAAGVP